MGTTKEVNTKKTAQNILAVYEDPDYYVNRRDFEHRKNDPKWLILMATFSGAEVIYKN